ncbi:MAG: hypothetical protein Q9163_001635 [Psora crenata]
MQTPAIDRAISTMGLGYAPPSPPLTPRTTQKAVQRAISCQTEDLPGHLHRIRTLRLSDGSRLVLKSSPCPSLCLLRNEYTYLDTEATVLELLADSGLPIPRIVKYNRGNTQLGSPFLLTTHLCGTRYADAFPYLTRDEHKNIELQLCSLRSIINQHISFRFGPAGLVKAGKGFATWRDAFIAMLESALMDGEDIMVNIPYSQIREAVSRWGTYLDDVTEARLLVPGLGLPGNTLIERTVNEVTGLLDFGQAVWGDLGLLGEREDGDIKGLMYTCYDSVLTIVRNHYRLEGDGCELDARKRLTEALRQLSAEYPELQ